METRIVPMIPWNLVVIIASGKKCERSERPPIGRLRTDSHFRGSLGAKRGEKKKRQLAGWLSRVELGGTWQRACNSAHAREKTELGFLSKRTRERHTRPPSRVVCGWWHTVVCTW